MKNGACWLDDAGQLIQAHSGMMVNFEGLWYWYGQNLGGPTIPNSTVGWRVDAIGISCYTSSDLLSWQYKGLALAARPDEPAHILYTGNVIERPKVFYAEKTGKYVMWFHADRADYTLACAGCAVADRPEGPFEFLYATQPNRRDCRDMTVFRDPADGRVYLVHAGDWNHTLYFSELSEELTGFTGVCYPQLIEQTREAPALCVHEGVYYCVTSGCTGWATNPALYATTNRVSTPMCMIDNPCEGEDYHRAFNSQGTWIFEAGGVNYIMLDHWRCDDIQRSGYSILPIEFDHGRMIIRWQAEFNGINA